MKQKVKKNREALEKSLVERHGVLPLGKEEYRNVQIWVGEAWRTAQQAAQHGHHEFPFGYYCGFYMLGFNDEKMDCVREVMFDAFHDPEIPHTDKRRARKNKLLQDARAHIDGMNAQVGFYQ